MMVIPGECLDLLLPAQHMDDPVGVHRDAWQIQNLAVQTREFAGQHAGVCTRSASHIQQLLATG